MSNVLTYKGFYGSIEFFEEDNVFHGKILGISDCFLYEGDSVQSLKQDFQDSVNEYIDFCNEVGKEPEKAYKGTFNVPIESSLHKKLSVYSSEHGKTLNGTVEEAIRHYVS
ncbi:MAG: type II toxin-antitoxin system HicB family antitoxin [Oscillospiraceae bacterium]|nr:type II toxin-antitoxin system HicB family antitoxin [Oscillospiraceae bacterium]